jgi:hypothetical protein
MITESLKEKINQLFVETPDNVSVAYGNKTTNNEKTGERAIIFMVDKKKPIDELLPNEILPQEIEVGGVIYKTDVVEVGIIKAMACDPTTLGQCYGWQTTPPSNRYITRPIQGGVSLSSKNNQGHVGTLGFIAVDIETQAIVGVTNNHVAIGDAFYTTERNLAGVLQNESSDNAYQPGESSTLPISWKVGEVVRYVPIYLPTSPNAYSNRVDGALISLTSSTISNSVSFKQLGLTGIFPMPFATTSELDNLLVTNPPLYSTGRTTGPKEGNPCGLIIETIGAYANVGGYKIQGATTNVFFSDLISFTRINRDCLYPIYPGDSGSALIANFNGVWKIIGLCFAGSDTVGIACRIDRVASELSIQAWDGTAKNYINPATKQTLTVPYSSSDKIINCSGQTYWQVGLTNVTNPKCV